MITYLGSLSCGVALSGTSHQAYAEHYTDSPLLVVCTHLKGVVSRGLFSCSRNWFIIYAQFTTCIWKTTVLWMRNWLVWMSLHVLKSALLSAQLWIRVIMFCVCVLSSLFPVVSWWRVFDCQWEKKVKERNEGVGDFLFFFICCQLIFCCLLHFYTHFLSCFSLFCFSLFLMVFREWLHWQIAFLPW